jgi:hypothetical protein
MAQRNIDFGTFPDDPDADAIRTAFQKTQENFTELFGGLQDQAVISVNRTAGAGITVNSPTGNVIVTANIACVQVSSNTLGVSRDSASYTAGGNATITSSSQTLVIELPNDIANVDNIALDANLTANVVKANLNVLVGSNAIVLANTGNATIGNVSVSGIINVTGNATVGNISTVNGTFSNSITVTTAANVGALNATTGAFVGTVTANNANVTNNVAANIITANFFYGDGSNISNVTSLPNDKISNGTSQVYVTLNGNVTSTVAGYDTLVVTATGANITGTLNATGNLTAVDANLGNSVTANYFVGNLYGAANTATSATTAGTVTTNAQPNITSVGTLTSLSVTGNADSGNVNATGGVFTYVNGNGANLTSLTGANVTGSVANATYANGVAGANVSGEVSYAATANSVAGGNVVGTVANAMHASTANTVVDATQSNITSVGTLTGLNVNGTITAVSITANTGTFTGNGSGLANLAGANVTGTVANATYALSAGSATTAGTVTTFAQPNITSVGTLTSLDVAGNVTASNVYANSGTIGAQTLKGEGGNISNIQGANVSGTVSSATTASTAGTVTTNAQPNITSVGSLTSLTVSGNINAGNVNLASGIFSGNGSGLSQLTGANVTGTVANATYALDAGNATNATSATSATTAATVTTNAQPNITSVGTLSSLSVTGNVDAGNFTGANAVVANYFIGSGNNLSNIQGANVTGAVATATSATTAGTVTTASQPNITSVGTLSSLSVTGNITSGNIYSNSGTIGALYLSGDGSNITNISVGAGSYIENGNSEVRADANSNVRVTVAGNANVVVVTGTGANIAGYANITGNVSAGNVTATLLTGTLTTASQPNVTNVGTLTGLNVNGTSNLGPNSNVIITGGAANAFLKTDGSGALSWDTATLVPAQGSNTQVIFNDGGSTYAGNANLTFNKTNATFTVGNSVVAGNVYANSGTVRGSLLTGTLTTAAQPNVTSVGTLTGLNVNGTVTAVAFTANTGIFTGNGAGLTNLAGANVTGTVPSATSATTAGTVTTAAQPNITSTGTLSSLIVSGNINAGNLNTTGVFSGSGSSLTNIPGGNVTGTVANATYATSAGSATTAGTVTTAAQPNITSVGTLSALDVTAGIVAGNVYANSGTVRGNLLTGTLTTAAQPNITSVGSLTSLIVNGNINAANLTVGLGTVTANIFSGNASNLTNIPGANVTGTVANATFALSASSATTAGTVTTNAQPNITSVGTLTTLDVNGTVTAVNFTANTGIFTGNGSGLTALNASNISTGTLAQARLANSSLTVNGTSISLGGSGTITAVNPNALTLGTYLTGTSYDGSTAVTAAVDATTTNTASKVVARDSNGSFSANIITATLSGSATSATSATTAGTVTTAAQPNITSVGTLTSLTSSGNISGANLVATAYTISSVATGISAAGSTQGTATALTKDVNVVSTVSAGQGVVLPTAVGGMRITVMNTSPTALNVYPATGAGINNNGANVAFALPGNGRLDFLAVTSTQWYTLTATYA